MNLPELKLNMGKKPTAALAEGGDGAGADDRRRREERCGAEGRCGYWRLVLDWEEKRREA